MIQFAGQAATAAIVLGICAIVALGMRDSIKSYNKGGMTAGIIAIIGCGVALFLAANVLKVPKIAGDTVQEVKKQGNKVKSQVPIGGTVTFKVSR